MDRKSKIFLMVFGALIVVSVVLTYYRIMVKKDYIIEALADCEPLEEKCFVWQCDPASTEEGEACTGDPESDISYYKILHRNAQYIPLCDPNEEGCEALVCGAGEPECEFVLCDDVTKVEQGVECNNPSKYRKINWHPEDEVADENADELVECPDAEVCNVEIVDDGSIGLVENEAAASTSTELDASPGIQGAELMEMPITENIGQ